MATKGKPSTTANLPVVQDPELAERFKRELDWCIDQLELMICSPSNKNKDPPRSALKILNSSKTSVIRKRQLMQQLFGDYRKKIQEEEETTTKRHNRIRVKENVQVPLASRFVRRIHSMDSTSNVPQEFSFNFQIPSTDVNES